jgi:methionyl-tRNA formyltransferase
MPKNMNIILKKLLKEKGLEQLDVYTYPNKDVIRVKRLSDQKVFLVEIHGGRKNFKPEDILNIVISNIKKK